MTPRQAEAIRRTLRDRLILYSGSTRSGKTVASVVEWLIWFMDRPGLHLIGGRTNRTVRDNVLSVIEALLPGQVHERTGQGDVMIAGRRALVVGMNDEQAAGKIKGLTLESAYLDELTELPESAVAMVLSRLDSVTASAIATTNPAGPGHWSYRAVLHNDVWSVERFRIADNAANLDPGYEARMRATHDELWCRRYLDGEWVAASGAIYPNIPVWEQDGIPDVLQWHVGVDVGVTNATAAVLLAECMGDRLIVVDECYLDAGDRSEEQQWEELRAWKTEMEKVHGARINRWKVDPSAPNMILMMRRAGESASGADNAVLDGIRLVGSLFTAKVLWVHRRCERLLSEGAGYVWDPKASEKGRDEPMKINDHVLDAKRYVVMSVGRRYYQALIAGTR